MQYTKYKHMFAFGGGDGFESNRLQNQIDER